MKLASSWKCLFFGCGRPTVGTVAVWPVKLAPDDQLFFACKSHDSELRRMFAPSSLHEEDVRFAVATLRQDAYRHYRDASVRNALEFFFLALGLAFQCRLHELALDVLLELLPSIRGLGWSFYAAQILTAHEWIISHGEGIVALWLPKIQQRMTSNRPTKASAKTRLTFMKEYVALYTDVPFLFRQNQRNVTELALGVRDELHASLNSSKAENLLYFSNATRLYALGLIGYDETYHDMIEKCVDPGRYLTNLTLMRSWKDMLVHGIVPLEELYESLEIAASSETINLWSLAEINVAVGVAERLSHRSVPHPEGLKHLLEANSLLAAAGVSTVVTPSIWLPQGFDIGAEICLYARHMTRDVLDEYALSYHLHTKNRQAFAPLPDARPRVSGRMIVAPPHCDHQSTSTYGSPNVPTIDVLFLSAAPRGFAALRSDQEFKAIQSAAERANLAKHGPAVRVEISLSTTKDDIFSKLLSTKPTIVHFSTHGTETGPTVEGAGGGADTVAAAGLVELVRKAQALECVVMNTCYAADYAHMLAAEVNYVIAMAEEVDDAIAIEFCKGFYEGLFLHAYDYYDSFDLGVARAGMSASIQVALFHDGGKRKVSRLL